MQSRRFEAPCEAEFGVAARLYALLVVVKLRRPSGAFPHTLDLMARLNCDRVAVNRAKAILVRTGVLAISRGDRSVPGSWFLQELVELPWEDQL